MTILNKCGKIFNILYADSRFRNINEVCHQLFKTFLSQGGSKETAPESRIAQIDKQAASIPEQRGGKRESRENRSHR